MFTKSDSALLLKTWRPPLFWKLKQYKTRIKEIMARKNASVKPEIFQAMQNVDIKKLSTFPDSELRSVLPCLVRAALCAPVDSSGKWTKYRKDVLKILAGVEVVNSIVALLSIDFHALEQDVKKEQQLR